MEDKDKRTLGYQPDIDYIEDYMSEYVNEEIEPESITDIDDLIDNTIHLVIEDNIVNIINLLSGMPDKIQTAVNQVFKPIYNEWYNDLRYRDYPQRIPDPDTPIIKPGVPDGTTPEPGEPDDPYRPPGIVLPPISGYDPNPDPIPDDIIGGSPGTILPGIINPEPYEPSFYIPDPDDDIIEPYVPEPVIVAPGDNNDFFDFDVPFIVEYEELLEKDIIDLEYSKNFLELIQYYTNRLNDILSVYTMGQYTAYAASKNAQDLIFILQNISINDVDVETNYRHLIDTGLRNEVIGNNKLDFAIKNFPLESSLYHLKNFKTAYNLRVRYSQEENMSSDNGGSMSNSMLKGAKALSSNKYDNAYINLYKYLNSSVKVLEDVFKNLNLGLKSKETLIKKGGRK
jgi:hypothetical protein